MRDGDNIRALEKLDIDWIGFIFYSGSPRYVADEDIDIIQSCSKIKVGVFVNEQPEEILRKVAKYRLNYVQLHGDESPDFCRRLRDAGCAVIKAFPVSSETDLTQTSAYEPFVDYFLFDTKGSERGGTGKRFNWSVLKAYRGNIPFLLSGGIGAEHISDLSELSHSMMAGFDLNSRFEVSPAMKDVGRIELFINNLRKSVSSALSAC
jgi:phosphoribosylanthranilate isomerase